MQLARYGALPQFVVFIVFGVAFFVLALVVVLTKVSERMLVIYSVIFWVFLVVLEYAVYAVQIHHTASNSVRTCLVITCDPPP